MIRKKVTLLQEIRVRDDRHQCLEPFALRPVCKVRSVYRSETEKGYSTILSNYHSSFFFYKTLTDTFIFIKIKLLRLRYCVTKEIALSLIASKTFFAL